MAKLQHGLGWMVALACFSSWVEPAPAASDQPAVATLEEVVITAQRRSESLQRVPVAVSAFTGDELELLNVGNTLDLLGKVPSSSFESQNGSTSANIYLRGIGSNGPNSTVVSAVGVYADDVSLNSPVVNVLQLYDLERIEVLRGPQNTLYGRNTTGGAINYISRKPVLGQQLDGYASITLGKWSQRDFSAALASGIGENAAFRAAVDYQYRDGVYENVNLNKDAYGRDKLAGRLQFLFQPVDGLEILLKGHIERVDNGNKLWQGIGLRDPSDPTQPCAAKAELGNGCADASGFIPSGSRTRYSASIDPIEKVDSGGASVTLNWVLGAMTLTSISAYEDNDYVKAEDVDTGPASFFDYGITSRQDQLSQELRLASNDKDSMKWVVGAFYFDEDVSSNTTAVNYAVGMANATRLDQGNRVHSLYGDLQWAIADNWSVIAGARWTEETKEGINNTAVRLLGNATVSGAILPFDGQAPPTVEDLLPLPSGMTYRIPYDKTWRDWGGKLGLQYSLSDVSLAYATVARGFKAGLFSNAPLQTIQGSFLPPANPEYLTSYEVGFKTTVLDGRLRTNWAAYYYDYSDQQLLVTAEVDGNQAAAYVNAGASTIYGLELEAEWAPAPGWSVSGSASWLQSRLDEYIDYTGIDYSGIGLANAPEWTVNAAVGRTWTVGSGAVLGINTDARYVSSRHFSLDRDVRTWDGAYTTVNASAYVDFGRDNRYRLMVWGRNLTDETWLVAKSPFEFAGVIEAQVSEPTSFGLTFKVSL